MLTNSILVKQPDASASIDPKKNNRSMTIVGQCKDAMRPPRCPEHAFFDFLFFLRLDQDVVGVERQIANLTCVSQFRASIKKKRLIVRIKRIKTFRVRHGRIDLHGNCLELLSRSQFRNERDCISRNANAGHDHERGDNQLTILSVKVYAAKKFWPGNFLCAQSSCAD